MKWKISSFSKTLCHHRERARSSGQQLTDVYIYICIMFKTKLGVIAAINDNMYMRKKSKKLKLLPRCVHIFYFHSRPRIERCGLFIFRLPVANQHTHTQTTYEKVMQHHNCNETLSATVWHATHFSFQKKK
jgi:hypothetical protein